MTDSKSKILDIAMNLNRIGNWAADDYLLKKDRIKTFLENTSFYIRNIDESKFQTKFAETFKDFKQKYPFLEREGLTGPKDNLIWAEEMMTWGNILTHRAKLIN